MSCDPDPDAQPSLQDDLLDRLASHNPSRAAHPLEVQQLAVSAVRELLRETSLSVSAAAADVAASIGCGMTTVLRWCRLAGVGRDDALVAREREWDARMAVTQRINRELADLTRQRSHGGGR